MKHILSSIILATITIGCFAQSDYKLTGKSDKISHLIKFMSADKMVGKASEQGRDRLDSTYYLDTRIYEFPYESCFNSHKQSVSVVPPPDDGGTIVG